MTVNGAISPYCLLSDFWYVTVLAKAIIICLYPGLISALPFSTHNNSISRRPKLLVDAPGTVGWHLHKVRTDRNLSKKAVAAMIGVSSSTILTWEYGKFKPGIMQMKGLIAFLGYYPFSELTTLAGQILKYRNVHGLTLEEFGRLVGVDGATVWTWENEKYVPAEAMRQKILTLINA